MTYIPQFSLEVFPPKRNAPVGTIYDTLDGLEGLKPDFISVTYGTGKSSDRTATARIANTITNEYNIPAVAHLTAHYADQAVVDEALEMFSKAGVTAVLALRGDSVEGREPAGVFEHASDLAAYIRRTQPEFDVYGACYPEKHPQASSLAEDIQHLKIKVDSGVSVLISQLFYDNEDFYRFLDAAHAAGINVPIEAGIMPVMNEASVRRMARTCQAKVPKTLESMLCKWGDNKEALRQAGIIYASQQISDLVAHGVDGVHLYSMNHPGTTRHIWRNVRSLFDKR